MYTHGFSQYTLFHASLDGEGVISTSNLVPFWIRSDQFGNVPFSGPSANLVGWVRKDYDTLKKSWIDWGASLEGLVNFGQETQATLIEGFGKLRLSIFEIMAGRVKQITGLVDSSLSSGSFTISGNALGVPQAQISIPDYFVIPFLGKLFAFKGNFANGIVGNVPIQDGLVKEAMTYYFQESFYGRFGKPDWRFKFKGGASHQGIWGSEKSIFGSDYKLTPWQTYEYALLAKTYNYSKIGKQMGSVDFAAEYDFDKIRLTLYRQFFIYVGAFFHLANLRDGLNGLSILNKSQGKKGAQWRKFLFEVFYSKDQAGYPWSKPTPSGAENYYNNYQYVQGWSYKGIGFGNPFITPYNTTRSNLPRSPYEYFNNNRLVAFYSGIEGSIGSYEFVTRFSYSLNYGTFSTSQWGITTAHIHTPPIWGQFGEVDQFSAYLEVKRPFNHGISLGLTAAFDNGGLFYNSTAVLLKCSKSF